MKLKLSILTLSIFFVVSAYSQINAPAYDAIINSNCVPASATFTNVIQSTSSYTVNHNWTFGNGNISTSSNPSSQTYTNAGVYKIIDTAFIKEPFTNTFLKKATVISATCTDPFNAVDLFLTLKDGQGNDIDITPFQANIAPPVSFTYTQTPNGFLLNSNSSYSINVQDDDAVASGIPGPADCGIVSFNSNSSQTTFTLTNGGLTLSVELIRVSGLRVTDTIVTTTQFTVNPLPTVSVNSGAICAGNSFTIIPTGAINYTYSTGSNIVTTNTTVTITGEDVNGCINTAVSSVTVNSLPTVSVNSGAICAGQSFTIVPTGAINYTYSSGSNIVTTNTAVTVTGEDVNGCINTAVSSVTVNSLPTVNVNSGAVCAGQSFTIVPTGAVNYTYSSGSNIVTTNTTVTVTGEDVNGCINTAISSVTVNSLPTVSATSNNTLICIEQSASLTATGADNYLWNTTDATSVIAVSPTVQTTYTVIGTDANNCTNTTTVTQDVSLCTGINTLAAIADNFFVYPNPSNGNFTLKSTNFGTYTIVDELGKVIQTINTNATNNYTVSITDLEIGIYFVLGVDNASRQKIIVTK